MHECILLVNSFFIIRLAIDKFDNIVYNYKR